MALAPEEEYVESGYFVASDYVGGIADAQVILVHPYIEDTDYIETGYFELSGVQTTLVASLSLAIVEASASLSSAFSQTVTTGTQHDGAATLNSSVTQTATPERIRGASADLSGAFAPSLTVNITASATIALSSNTAMSVSGDRFRTSDVLLSFQAALDAQADRIRGIDADLDAVALIGHEENGGFANNVLPAVTFSGAADFTSTCSLSVAALIVQLAEADLSSSATLACSPIEYRSKWVDTDRPITWDYYTSTGLSGGTQTATFDTTAKYGSHSIYLTAANYFLRTSGNLDEYWSDLRSGEFVMEGWIRSSTNSNIFTTNELVFAIHDFPSGLNNQLTNIDRLQHNASIPIAVTVGDDDLNLHINFNDNSYNNILSTILPSTTGWNHIVVRRVSNGNIEFRIDGTLIGTDTSGKDLKTNTDQFLLINNPLSSFNDFFVDEFSFRVGSSDILSSTSEAGNTEDTFVLSHFNNTVDDDLATELSGSSSLSSSSTLTATITGTQTGAADLTAFYTQLSVAVKTGDFLVDMDAVAGLTVSGSRTRFVTADLDSAAGLSADLEVIRGFAADFNSAAGITADTGIVKSAEAGFFTAMLQSAIPSRTRGAELSVNSAFSVDVAASITATGAADFNSASTLSATGERAVDADAGLNSAFTADISGALVAGGSTDFDSIATQLAVVAFIGNPLVTLEPRFTQSTTANADFSGNSTISAEFDQTASSTAIRDHDAVLNSAFGLSVDANVTASGASTQNAAAGISTTPGRIRSNSSTLNSAANLTCDASRIPLFGVEESMAFGISIDAARLRDSEIPLNSAFTTGISGGIIFEVSVDLTAFAVVISVNKILHLDQYEYVIPAETRIYSIEAETRTHSIVQETRTYSIEGA